MKRKLLGLMLAVSIFATLANGALASEVQGATSALSVPSDEYVEDEAEDLEDTNESIDDDELEDTEAIEETEDLEETEELEEGESSEEDDMEEVEDSEDYEEEEDSEETDEFDVSDEYSLDDNESLYDFYDYGNRTDLFGGQGTAVETQNTISVKGSDVIGKGKSRTYEAYYANGNKTKNVNWSVSPSNKYLTISSGGVLSVKSNCTLTECTVTAVSKTDSSIKADMIVTINPSYVSSLEIYKGGSKINGNTIKLFKCEGNFNARTTAKVDVKAVLDNKGDYNKRPYVITSANTKIVTVDEDGNIRTTGNGDGKVKITVKAIDGARNSDNKADYSTSFYVNVVNPVSGIKISIPSGRTKYVAKGKTLELSKTVLQAFGKVTDSAKKVSWSSSNSTVATVKNGVVTMKADSYTPVTITAKAIDGSGASASIELIGVCSIKNISVGFMPYSKAYESEKNSYSFKFYLSNGPQVLPVIYNEPDGGNALNKCVTPDLKVTSSLTKYLDVSYENGYITIIPKAKCTDKNLYLTVKAKDGSGFTRKWNLKVYN
ncbi:Ig-like domain-containing protein [Butyrivibrio sp. MC2013]|uniref:Ig-like domain-containing protein n=1 Tax=Butyrivibrio sp. MC2013 TaxID=1280686 RepID=UPI0003F898E0|nr:Ig-like domain-containing protein [Butyrivibrio sp. MC2013]